MKKLYIGSLFVLALSLSYSCSSDDGENNLENAESQLCSEIQGPAAVYWDFAHSIPAPLSATPTIENPGQQFVHSIQPLIGFVIPQGFTAFEVTEAETQTLGVNVIRNDNAVVFRYIPNTQARGQVSATTIIANEINTLFAFYEFNGSADVVCTTPTINSSFGGIPSQFTARLLQFNGITAQV